MLKDKIYISITEFLSIQKDQYHHPHKETHIDAFTHHLALNPVLHCNAFMHIQPFMNTG